MQQLYRSFLILLILTGTAYGQSQNTLQLELILDEGHSDFGALRCQGLEKDLLDHLQEAEAVEARLKTLVKVFPVAASARPDDLPGMLGQFQLRSSALLFHPRLPFIEGKNYQVQIEVPGLYRLAGLDFPQSQIPEHLSATMAIPLQGSLARTSVVQVYPTSSELPANLLKWYLCFSAPMSLESVYPHLYLLDEKGEKTAAPFLELTPELWDQQRQRLTLWMDPGRIKSHLAPNRELGQPMEAGKTYTLLIDTTFRDAYGQFLEKPFRKTFRTLPSDHRQPQPENWEVVTPPAYTRAPLELYFPEALDFGVLNHSMAVFAAGDQMIAGATAIGPEEKSWSLTPPHPWSPGRYQLRISKNLEDLAGNNLERPFDREVTDPTATGEMMKKQEIDFITLEFIIEEAE